MKIIVITGPPYSGKGTQCEVLEAGLSLKHISTGDRIRVEKKQNTELGKVMEIYEEKGMLVPDSIMEKLLAQIIFENKAKKGIILDGYPRTIPQVDTLIKLLQEQQEQISRVINIEVPSAELLQRAKERAKHSERKDDQDEVIHIKRIEVFEKETKPAIQYFKTITRVDDIDGIGTIEEITERIKLTLKS